VRKYALALTAALLLVVVPASAAVEFIAADSGAVTSLTLPGAWAAGDIAVVFAFRSGNTTPPTLPTGWTNINNGATGGGGTNCSSRSGYRVLQAGDSTTGTWTNATHLAVSIYRGQKAASPIGGSALGTQNSTSTIMRFAALAQTESTSVFLHGGGKVGTFTAAAATGWTLRSSFDTGANARIQFSDFLAPGGDWATQDVSVGGTSSKYHSQTIELLAEPPPSTRSRAIVISRLLPRP